jgi:hypothetical protein
MYDIISHSCGDATFAPIPRPCDGKNLIRLLVCTCGCGSSEACPDHTCEIVMRCLNDIHVHRNEVNVLHGNEICRDCHISSKMNRIEVESLIIRVLARALFCMRSEGVRGGEKRVQRIRWLNLFKWGNPSWGEVILDKYIHALLRR